MTAAGFSSHLSSRRFAARGFSLVELMVAMALSLVLLGGVLAIFASSRTTYETTDRLSRIQETGRFALDSITRDLRAAGYIGCSQRATLNNTLNNSATILWNFAVPLGGFDGKGGTTWTPVLDTSVLPDSGADSGAPDADSDAIVMRIPKHDIAGARMVKDMTSTNGDLEIDAVSAPAIREGDTVMISDCAARTVFEVTAKAGNVLSHAKVETVEEGATTPGNATDDLGQAYTSNAEVTPLQTVIYYIGEGSTPGAGTSLWRRVSGASGAEELVEGVENMQIQFGQRDAVGPNITYELRADQVTNWNNVVAVTVALLVRSLSEYGVDEDSSTYTLLGKSVVATGDRHMRQIFTTTATLRNQTL